MRFGGIVVGFYRRVKIQPSLIWSKFNPQKRVQPIRLNPLKMLA